MRPSFNLTDEPWIPCLFTGESRPRDVSIREALAEASSIQKLIDPSPLVTVALHRLLLAILHRVFGPETEDDWVRLWDAGSFDASCLDSYLDAWRHRFDLFDDERPFYQTPGLSHSAATTSVKLGHEFSAGNNPLLFDHSHDAEPTLLTPAGAARLLIAHHGFAIGGLIARLPGQPPSAEAAHLVKAAVMVATGENLFQTLMLNLVRLDGDAGDPFPFDSKQDAPTWEQDLQPPGTRDMRGYLDLLTWQSRSILLIPSATEPLRVPRAVIMSGSRMLPAISMAQRETMVAFSRREKPAANQDPEPPVGFRPERALWRDSVALIRRRNNDHRSPQTLRFITSLRQAGYLDDGLSVGLAAYGMSSDRAKVFLWRHEELPLPLAYLGNDDLVAELGSGIAVAEAVGKVLRDAVWRLAQDALAPDGNADRARVTALCDALAPGRGYWPALDVPFRHLMRALPASYESDQGAASKEDWSAAIRSASGEAFESAARALETSGHGYQAAAMARSRFYRQLAGALGPLRLDAPPVLEESA